MRGVAYAAALLLAFVFVRAGFAKLRNRDGTARTFDAFGLPPGSAVAVPIVELVLAIVLVVAPGWGGALALALLAAFTTFLARAVCAGVRVGCNCFGSARHAPVSWVELVRNGFLALAAIAALTSSTPEMPGAGAVLTVVLVGVAAMAALRVAEDRRRAGDEGPPVGAPAPAIPDVAWVETTVIAFLAPSCPGCAEARRLVAALELRVHVVELDDRTRPLFDAYRVRATPFYVVVDAAGIVRSRGPDAKVLQSAT